MKFALILFLVFMTGCTTYYTHPTKSNQEFYGDNAQCQGQSGQACNMGYGGNNLGTWACRTNVYNSCMMGKGWQEE